ncbi:hypothetical protein ANTPLA_LOCUS1572 [Anthophora plagiata]
MAHVSIIGVTIGNCSKYIFPAKSWNFYVRRNLIFNYLSRKRHTSKMCRFRDNRFNFHETFFISLNTYIPHASIFKPKLARTSGIITVYRGRFTKQECKFLQSTGTPSPDTISPRKFQRKERRKTEKRGSVRSVS